MAQQSLRAVYIFLKIKIKKKQTKVHGFAWHLAYAFLLEVHMKF